MLLLGFSFTLSIIFESYLNILPICTITDIFSYNVQVFFFFQDICFMNEKGRIPRDLRVFSFQD